VLLLRIELLLRIHILREKQHFGEKGLDRRVILRQVLEKEFCSRGYLLYLARHVGQQLATKSNEQENRISDSINERGFLTMSAIVRSSAPYGYLIWWTKEQNVYFVKKCFRKGMANTVKNNGSVL
jgi:hypothetical protein